MLCYDSAVCKWAPKQIERRAYDSHLLKIICQCAKAIAQRRQSRAQVRLALRLRGCSKAAGFRKSNRNNINCYELASGYC